MNKNPTVALIGSFRKHYPEILNVRQVFLDHQIQVVHPLGNSISKEGDFIRFKGEFEDESIPDFQIQNLAVARILLADVVFVVNPNGYLGRTTCYEVGRLIQAEKTIYWMEVPLDLPVEVPLSNITSPQNLILSLQKGSIQ